MNILEMLMFIHDVSVRISGNKSEYKFSVLAYDHLKRPILIHKFKIQHHRTVVYELQIEYNTQTECTLTYYVNNNVAYEQALKYENYTITSVYDDSINMFTTKTQYYIMQNHVQIHETRMSQHGVFNDSYLCNLFD